MDVRAAHWERVLERIQADPRYRVNLAGGTPRQGHPEGSIGAHIEQLEGNLARLSASLSAGSLSAEEVARLRVLVHVHDTFKPEAIDGVGIDDPRSHASLARAFLAGFTDDADLLAMVQWHDVPYALWRRVESGKDLDEARLARLIEEIRDWRLFNAFLILDGCTPGKSRRPLEWFLTLIAGRVEGALGVGDIPPA